LSNTAPPGSITLNLRAPNVLDGVNGKAEEISNDFAGAATDRVALQIVNGKDTPANACDALVLSSLKSWKATGESINLNIPPGRSNCDCEPCKASGKLPRPRMIWYGWLAFTDAFTVVFCMVAVVANGSRKADHSNVSSAGIEIKPGCIVAPHSVPQSNK
jgi:hypothetical protein